MKTNKGISLIVLVITIIVMIILAGTIILTLSNNGIIDKASEAVKETNIKQLKQDITSTLLMQGWYEDKDFTSDAFMGYLEKIPDVTSVEKLTEGTWKVERKGTVITVYESGEIIDGTIHIWDGNTIKAPKINEGIWYIYNGEELKFLEQFVNNGSKLTEVQKVKVQEAGYVESDYVITETTQVHLMADIDLGARQKDGNLITKPETQWNPIGQGQEVKFIGIFEGNGHYITGVYINKDTNYCGIFGSAVEINDLTVKNSYIAGKSAVGGIVGYAEKIINCHNIDTYVKGIQAESKYVGGIVAVTKESSEVKNCSNTGSITSEGKYVGGIVGCSTKLGKISECINKGNIIGEDQHVGGIVGCSAKLGEIINCRNTGNITGYSTYVAGIVGCGNPSTQINNCINKGYVLGQDEYVGGIVGLLATDSKDPSEVQPSKVTYCINTGNIVGKDLNTGGIVGCLAQYGSIVERCYNIGMISGNEKVAGILGEMGRSSKLINCYNIANVKGNDSVGGLIGKTYNSAGAIKNSYNIGKIAGSSRIGGIIGNNTNGSTITNSYYLQGTATLDQGSGTTTDLMKTAEYIKTTFLTNANATETIWEIRQGKNNEYPMIIGLE